MNDKEKLEEIERIVLKSQFLYEYVELRQALKRIQTICSPGRHKI